MREDFFGKIEQGRVEAGLFEFLLRDEIQEVVGRIHEIDDHGNQQGEDAEGHHDAQEFVEPAQQGNLDNFLDDPAE